MSLKEFSIVIRFILFAAIILYAPILFESSKTIQNPSSDKIMICEYCVFVKWITES